MGSKAARQRHSRQRHSGQRGYTVVELSLALLISVIALAIAADLLLESQRRSLIENQRALDPSLTIAVEQLRADVTAAVDGSGVAGVDPALVLSVPSLPPVRWELRSGQLLRTVGDPLPDNERPVLSGVRSFVWVWLAGGPLSAFGDKPLLQIDFDYSVVRLPGPEVAKGARVWLPRETLHESLVLTLRGGGGTGW